MNVTLQEICTTRRLVKEHGKVSPAFLMMKMKIEYQKANELYEEYGYSGIKEKINNRFN